MLVRKSVYLFGVLMTHFNQKYIKSPSREYNSWVKIRCTFLRGLSLYFIYKMNNPFSNPHFFKFLCALRIEMENYLIIMTMGNVIN